MKGVGELLEVYEDRLAITPKGVMGFLSKGLKGTKTIPFTSITAIQLKRSGLTSGYIQFTVPGGNESRGGVFGAAFDENTFMFAGQNERAQEVTTYIETRMREVRTPAAAPAARSLTDELRQLAELRRTGVLSEAEFLSAKRRLLGEG